jgi:hypothetical protein
MYHSNELLCSSTIVNNIVAMRLLLLLGGYPKNFDDSPNTREREREFLARSNTKSEHGVIVIPSADCTSSQKSESVYTCPRAPFYREMKGLLHTENTLRLKEYF